MSDAKDIAHNGGVRKSVGPPTVLIQPQVLSLVPSTVSKAATYLKQYAALCNFWWDTKQIERVNIGKTDKLYLQTLVPISS